MNDQCMNCKIRKFCTRPEPFIDGTCEHFVEEGTYIKWMDGDEPTKSGFDPGAPEGDQTNVRLDWGESGRELIGPRVDIDDDERGPVLAVTRMPLETVIGYAIDGIKDHVSKIGLPLTDKTLGEHELFELTHDLANLHERWVTLETERTEIQKAVEGAKHGNGND